jgi:hypothetical protein
MIEKAKADKWEKIDTRNVRRLPTYTTANQRERESILSPILIFHRYASALVEYSSATHQSNQAASGKLHCDSRQQQMGTSAVAKRSGVQASHSSERLYKSQYLTLISKQ